MIKVSVIMPAYNAAKYIADSIESVRAQTYKEWELIIVDDGSVDETREIVQSYIEKDSRIKYLWQENGKQAKARNYGMVESSGEWIAFLDADDLWMPQKLDSQILAIKNYGVDIVFTSGFYLGEETQQLTPYDSISGQFTGTELYKTLYTHNHIAVLSVMFKKELTKVIGFQDESLLIHGCEDWDYWLRMCRSNAKFYGMNERLFKYRVHSTSTSSNKTNMHMALCYVLHKNFDSALLPVQEQKAAISLLSGTIKSLLPAFYDKGEMGKLCYYLNIVVKHTNSERFKAAGLLVRLLGKKSRRLVTYVVK